MVSAGKKKRPLFAKSKSAKGRPHGTGKSACATESDYGRLLSMRTKGGTYFECQHDSPLGSLPLDVR